MRIVGIVACVNWHENVMGRTSKDRDREKERARCWSRPLKTPTRFRRIHAMYKVSNAINF